jgi:hypothetical protein
VFEMPEILTFHFEGSLADSHRMNFYESARFQYAAARLMVKLAQFRAGGKFVQKITNNSNFNIQLTSQSEGSFNINVEDPGQGASKDDFIKISLADLIAYVSERIVEKIDEAALTNAPATLGEGAPVAPTSVIDQLAAAAIAGQPINPGLPVEIQDLVKRRVAETHRERRMVESESAISRIDFARSQKLIAMSAPLISEMATALRKSANTLEIRSSAHGQTSPVLFLDQKMAQEIETAVVDGAITPILGDIIQFNKDNGWGKIKIENGAKTVSFSIPYDILPTIRQKLIDNMKRDQVYLQTYFVRNPAGEVIRMIAVGILPTPTA